MFTILLYSCKTFFEKRVCIIIDTRQHHFTLGVYKAIFTILLYQCKTFGEFVYSFKLLAKQESPLTIYKIPYAGLGIYCNDDFRRG